MASPIHCVPLVLLSGLFPWVGPSALADCGIGGTFSPAPPLCRPRFPHLRRPQALPRPECSRASPATFTAPAPIRHDRPSFQEAP